MAKVTIEEAESLRVGPDFEIASVDPASTPGLSDGNVDSAYSDFDEEIAELQECLYANGRAGNENAGSVLLVLQGMDCLLYTSPSPRDLSTSRMPSSA